MMKVNTVDPKFVEVNDGDTVYRVIEGSDAHLQLLMEKVQNLTIKVEEEKAKTRASIEVVSKLEEAQAFAHKSLDTIGGYAKLISEQQKKIALLENVVNDQMEMIKDLASKIKPEPQLGKKGPQAYVEEEETKPKINKDFIKKTKINKDLFEKFLKE